MVVGKVPIWTAVRHLSRARKVSADRPGLAHFLPATFMPIPPLCFCHLVPVSGEYYPGSTFAARVPIAAATLASANVSPSEAASPRAAARVSIAVAIATAAATAAAASASTHPFQLLVLRRVAAAAVVVRWGGQGICSRTGGHPLLEALSTTAKFLFPEFHRAGSAL